MPDTKLLDRHTDAKRILVVDGEVSVRNVVSVGLLKRGFEVETAANAAEAWHLAKEGDWHLISLEVALPDGDGLELLRSIKRILPQVPIVLLSGLTLDRELVEQARQNGAIACLSKALSLDIFLQRIESILTRSAG